MSAQYSFIEYLIINFKDPIYYTLNFFFYNFISSEFSYFLFFLTFISYFFLTKAAYNFSKAIGFSHSFSLITVILVILFPQIFSFSGHILRQFLALSFGYYCLSIFYFTKTKHWPIFGLIISTFIHSSNLLLLLFLFFKYDIKKFLKFTFILTPLGFLLYRLYYSDNVLINGFKRVSNLSTGGSELETISISVLILCLAIFFFNQLVNYYNKKNTSKVYFDRIFFSINSLILFFILSGNTELSVRLLPILYFLWPIILVSIIRVLGISLHLSLFFVFLVFGLFVLNLFTGTWQYSNLLSSLFTLSSFF